MYIFNIIGLLSQRYITSIIFRKKFKVYFLCFKILISFSYYSIAFIKIFNLLLSKEKKSGQPSNYLIN